MIDVDVRDTDGGDVGRVESALDQRLRDVLWGNHLAAPLAHLLCEFRHKFCPILVYSEVENNCFRTCGVAYEET